MGLLIARVSRATQYAMDVRGLSLLSAQSVGSLLSTATVLPNARVPSMPARSECVCRATRSVPAVRALLPATANLPLPTPRPVSTSNAAVRV